MNLKQVKSEWFSNVRGDVLSGILVALALMPEAIAFSIIAGVDPKVGLYASFAIAVTISFFGGRPGMISAATGAMALLMIPLIKEHGLPFLFAATVLTGVFQIIFGLLKLSRYMKFVPRPVMVGFVNALAILIFMAQLPHFVGEGWIMYAMVAVSLVIIYVLPRFSKAIPSALVAIIVMTLLAIFMGLPLRRVGDMGQLPTALPVFGIPMVPFTLETLMIIFPYSLAMMMVGLIESLLTATIVDDYTDTTSDKHRESRGQGVANIVAGFFGGMAGCAMIGQSVINMKSGGRGRLSTFIAGVGLLFFIVVLNRWVSQIPMGVLVAIMFMVSFGTFDWGSVKNIHRIPLGEALVMVLTVGVVLYTHDLSKGVVAGILFSSILFARKVAKLVSVTSWDEGDLCTYRVEGEIFFASVTEFTSGFDLRKESKNVEIDLTHAHLWDGCAIAAIDKVVIKLRKNGSSVHITGLNEASETLMDKLATHNNPGVMEAASGH